MGFLSQVFKTVEAFAPVVPPLINAIEGIGNSNNVQAAPPSPPIKGPNGILFMLWDKKLWALNWDSKKYLEFSHTQPVFGQPNEEPTGYESDYSVIPPNSWANMTEDMKTYIHPEAFSTYSTQENAPDGSDEVAVGVLKRTFSFSMAALATGVTYALKNGNLKVNYDAAKKQIKVDSAIPPLQLQFVYDTDSGQTAQAELSWRKPPGEIAASELKSYVIDIPPDSDGDGVLHNLIMTMQYQDSGSSASDILVGEKRKALVQPIPEDVLEVLNKYQSESISKVA